MKFPTLVVQTAALAALATLAASPAAFAQAGAAAPVQPAASAVHPDAAASLPAPAPLPLADPRTLSFVDGLLTRWYAPAARRFAADGEVLAGSVRAWCAAAPPPAGDTAPDAARQAWVRAMLSWTSLSAVPVGPLLDRRSETRLDFLPMRPAALDKVIAHPAAPGSWDMDRVGAQARGLPAMEYLLWKHAPAPGTPACAYLAVLARDLRDEAQGLQADFEAEAASSRDAGQAAVWLNTYVNQWLSGMGRMRWRDLEMPVRSWGMDQAPRAASGQTTHAWQARWQTLRVLTTGGPGTPEGMLPLAGYLRARGLTAAADTLERDARRADEALMAATPGSPMPQLLDAARLVDTVTHTLLRDVPAALQVQLEFAAEDGD